MTIYRKILVPLLMIAATSLFSRVFCQSKSIPANAISNFNSKFPQAMKVQWGGDVSSGFHVYFLLDSTQSEAKFDAAGEWINTEMKIKKDSLPENIKEGLLSSAYASWMIHSAFIIYFPQQIIHYRVVVINADKTKKIISFNQKGQLIKDDFSL
jgi:hypothetical protein